MEFDAFGLSLSFPRRTIFARNGMVCTGQPLAAQAGLRMLLQGGNAIDAALATAICLTVVEPTATGWAAMPLPWCGSKTISTVSTAAVRPPAS